MHPTLFTTLVNKVRIPAQWGCVVSARPGLPPLVHRGREEVRQGVVATDRDATGLIWWVLQETVVVSKPIRLVGQLTQVRPPTSSPVRGPPLAVQQRCVRPRLSWGVCTATCTR